LAVGEPILRCRVIAEVLGSDGAEAEVCRLGDVNVDDFLAQKTMAVVGVSRGGKKFGNAILKDLKQKGYRVFPVNPHAASIDGERCYPDLMESLPWFHRL